MRLVIASKKYIGKKLAQPIKTSTGILFAHIGTELTQQVIDKIKTMGINYIYIEEPFAHDVVITPVFEDNTKTTLLNNLIRLYTQIQKNQSIDIRLLAQIVIMIQDEINLTENAFLFRDIFKNEIEELAFHSIEVAIYCFAIARNNNMKYQDIEKLIASAILHDIGKLVKNSNSSTHHEMAVNIIRTNITISPVIYIPILHLHEKIDGSGPYKIKGDKLHVHAQILHIANNYSNLAQKESDINQRIEIFNMEASNRYDLELFKKANEILYCYPNGIMVELTNAKVGIVIKQNVGFPSRPLIVTTQGEVINLLHETTTFIKKTIN
ncbi:hypothetical protein AN641_02840 [Candidatus Epulonipiscioides gigas]|nr:hypothetical protein AN641_02840 [Epulopiscium sp. SCG-C07WGA-EpuloA2]